MPAGGEGEGIPRRLLRSASARRYLALRGGTVELDPERIRSDAVYDGKWVLATNMLDGSDSFQVLF